MFNSVIKDLIDYNSLLEEEMQAANDEYIANKENLDIARRKALYKRYLKERPKDYKRLKFGVFTREAIYENDYFKITDRYLYINKNKYRECKTESIARLEADLFIIRKYGLNNG
jgi:hypothetical protein